MTPRQQECLEAIKAYIAEHGRSPSLRELGRLIKTEVSGAHGLILHLERQGVVRRTPGRHCSIEVLDSPLARMRKGFEEIVELVDRQADPRLIRMRATAELNN